MFRITALDLPPIASANGVVSLPGSKSISNRVLLLSALSDGITTIHDLLDSDDTRVMLRALEQLGCNVEQEVDGVCRIEGIGGRAHCMHASLFLGNAGTAMRPLTAALALLSGQFELHGVERMHQRPIGDLVDALRQLGCLIEYAGDDGFPPLKIRGADRTELKLDKPVAVRGDVSSQFLTALLLALPLAAKERPVVIEVLGTLISRPYIEITLNLLQRFGIKIERDEWRRFIIPAGSQYRTPGDIHIEADASSASYFIAAGALGANAAKGHSIRIEGVGDQSIQGDIRFVDAARRMGASIETEANTLTVSRGAWPLRAIDMDCNQIPDAAMTLAVMALFADGPSLLRNIASWRVKETDRIDAMAAELGRLGARVESGADYIRIWPLASADWKAAAIRTYDDHRMAMCFSLAAFNPARRPVRIFDPSCVSKTFPDYFEALLDVTLPVQDEVPVICVDGPTASGKGTLASALAERLGYHYLDSGAIYRAVGVAMRQRGFRPEPVDESAIAEMARALPLRFKFDSVFIGSVDVTAEIRSESAGMDASRVSTLSLVRNALFALQTGFLRAPGLVADGRDMGTVVFPQARLKVFLTASAEHRADRRYRQLISKGKTANIVDLRVGLEARDLRDMSRQIAPLAPASDACFLDNSGLSIEQSVDRVLEWWRQRQPFEATA